MGFDAKKGSLRIHFSAYKKDDVFSVVFFINFTFLH